MSCLHTTVSCTPTLFTSEHFLHFNSFMLSIFTFLKFEMWSSLILWALTINRSSLFLLVPCVWPPKFYIGRVINWGHGTKAVFRQAVFRSTIFQKHLVIYLVFLPRCMCLDMYVYMRVYVGGHTCMWVHMSLYALGGPKSMLRYSLTILPSFSFEAGYQDQNQKLLIWGSSAFFPEIFQGLSHERWDYLKSLICSLASFFQGIPCLCFPRLEI